MEQKVQRFRPFKQTNLKLSSALFRRKPVWVHSLPSLGMKILSNHSRCEREGQPCHLQGEVRTLSHKTTLFSCFQNAKTHAQDVQKNNNRTHTLCYVHDPDKIQATPPLWKNNPPERGGKAPSGPYGWGPYKELETQHKAGGWHHAHPPVHWGISCATWASSWRGEPLAGVHFVLRATGGKREARQCASITLLCNHVIKQKVLMTEVVFLLRWLSAR